VNKQQAKKIAHRCAWQVLKRAFDQGRIGETLASKTAQDRRRIEEAYDDLIQAHVARCGYDPDENKK